MPVQLYTSHQYLRGALVRAACSSGSACAASLAAAAALARRLCRKPAPHWWPAGCPRETSRSLWQLRIVQPCPSAPFPPAPTPWAWQVRPRRLRARRCTAAVPLFPGAAPGGRRCLVFSSKAEHGGARYSLNQAGAPPVQPLTCTPPSNTQPVAPPPLPLQLSTTRRPSLRPGSRYWRTAGAGCVQPTGLLSAVCWQSRHRRRCPDWLASSCCHPCPPPLLPHLPEDTSSSRVT